MKNAAAKRRRAAGESAEDALEIVHSIAMARREAWIRKVPSAYKVIGKAAGPGLIVVPEVKVGVDYVGVLPGGRALYVECKRCSEGTFPTKHVEVHQRQELDTAQALGASCWLVIVWDPSTRQAKERLSLKGLAVPALVAIPWEIARTFDVSIPSDVLVEHACKWSFYARC